MVIQALLDPTLQFESKIHALITLGNIGLDGNVTLKVFIKYNKI